MTPVARKQVVDAMTALAGQCKVVALVPSSVTTLAEGFQALQQIEARMHKWAEANPEMFKNVPAAALRSFRMQSALLDEARQVLASMTATMCAMKQECEATKTNVKGTK